MKPEELWLEKREPSRRVRRAFAMLTIRKTRAGEGKSLAILERAIISYIKSITVGSLG